MKKITKILGTTTLATAVLFSTTGVTQATTWTDNPVSDTDSQLEGTPVDPTDMGPVQPDVVGGINPFFDLNGNNIMEPGEPYYDLFKEIYLTQYKGLKQQQNSLNDKIRKVSENQKTLQKQIDNLNKQEISLKKSLKKTTKIKTKNSIQTKINKIYNQKNKTQLKLNELKKQENNLKVELHKVNQHINSVKKVKI